MKKLLFILLLFPSLVYADLDVCESPQITSYEFNNTSGGTTSCSSASDCASAYASQILTTEAITSNSSAGVISSSGLTIQYNLVSSWSYSPDSTLASWLSVILVCTETLNQCEGNSDNAAFYFTSNEDNGGSAAPSSICTGGCISTKVQGNSITFGSGGIGGFTGSYQPTDSACTASEETNGEESVIGDINVIDFDLDNESVKAFEDTEQCATDSLGNSTCVPLVEVGTASITNDEGRDLEVNPQGQNCGTVNGAFSCIESTEQGIATLTDSEGNVFTLDEPKNPINNPAINITSGDSDSSYDLTNNSSLGTSVSNSSNDSGGSGTNTGTTTETTTGTTDGDVDSAGIIAANKVTSDSVTALSVTNTTNANSIRADINTNADLTNAKIDTVTNAVADGTSAITSGLDAVTQAINDKAVGGGGVATDMSGTIAAINTVNTSVQETLTELKTLTDDSEYVSPEVPASTESYDGIYTKLSETPFIAAVTNINIGFSGQSCSAPSVTFSILGNTINGDMSIICTFINDAGDMIGAIMMFIYSLLALFIFMRK